MAREADSQNQIRIEGAKVGLYLMRNNVGVLRDVVGRPVRFGLMNDSSELNKKCKSSDLIGLYTKTGQFVAVECKEPGWTYRGTDREVAQLAFINLVKSKGGLACFATCWNDVKKEFGL